MTSSSRMQRNHLTRALKGFAYEHSPMFAEGLIQAMEERQSYLLVEENPKQAQELGGLRSEQTSVILGFYATRLTRENGKKPAYIFDVSMTARRLLHPRQMTLSDTAWHLLRHNYLDETWDESLDAETAQELAALPDDDVRDETIDEIIDAGDECEQYQQITYIFSTHEPDIELKYERGVTVGDEGYDILSTHDYADDDSWEYVQTASGEDHWIPRQHSTDELSIGDEIEVRQQFADIVDSLKLQDEAHMNMLTPYEDKMTELLYLVECMKRRRINLR